LEIGKRKTSKISREQESLNVMRYSE